jgi:hypothetical protein
MMVADHVSIGHPKDRRPFLAGDSLSLLVLELP